MSNTLEKTLLDEKEFLSTLEVEKYYSVKKSTLRRQRWGGYGIPFYVVGRNPKKRRGGVILYKKEDVESYISKHRRETVY